jgi:hypothetical protein
MKPTILVTSAAGHTGSSTVLELLGMGFPVRALVRRADARSESLKKAGAEIMIGDLFDLRDLRVALKGVRRAYHCPPFGPNLLHGSMLFALAAVVAGVLAEPGAHVGQIHRPTGPELISGHDAAATIGRVLSRPVRYRDVSTNMFTKAAAAQGFSLFEIAQIRHYAEEVRAGVYAVSAPTDHVQRVSGRPTEPFETTARRYVANPERVMPGLSIGTRLGAMALMLKTALMPTPDVDHWVSERGYPLLSDSVLAHDSEAWRASAASRRLVLLQPENDALPVSSPPWWCHCCW